MVEQLKKLMEDLTQKIAVKKTITSHSKPWISNEISEIFKELRGARNRVKKHKSPGNIKRYHDLLKLTSEKLEKAQDEYIVQECEKLNGMRDNKNWKAISKLLNHKQNSNSPANESWR